MNHAAFSVLYVDDDRANLASFQYLLDDRFQILTASHSDQALEILAQGRTAVLLADQRMESGLSGVELCALTRKQYPDVVRMIVTAYADVPTLQTGINEGQIRGYLRKPWDEHDMVGKLRDAIDVHQFETGTRRLQTSLLKWDQLSTSSFVMGHLLHELCNPITAVRDNLDFSVRALSTSTMDEALAGLSLQATQCVRELRAALDDASIAANALVARMSHLRDNAFAPGPTAGVASLGPVVQTAVAIVREEAEKRVHVVVEIQAIAEVAADPLRVSQIVTSLLVGAVETVVPGAPGENRITISTFATERSAGVTIEAVGPGVAGVSSVDPLDPFEPFPHAPESHAGGLALALVRDLARAAHGDVKVQASRDGRRGRTFSVELPRALNARSPGL